MSLDPRTARTIRELTRRLARLEAQQLATARASQASHRSLEGGPLQVYDSDGVLRTSIGAQSDGSFTVKDTNGAPPPVPSTPLVDATKPGVLVVEWDGFTADGSDWPADFDRVEVHVNTTPTQPPTNTNEVASFHSVNGGTITLALDPVAQYVTFTAVNTSEVESDASVEVTATPAAPAASVLPAPVSSPVPVVNGGIDAFTVSWVLQPTGTSVEVHASTVAGFTPSAATLATTTDGNSATIVRLPTGDPFTYTVGYYFRTIAYTEGGAAAPSGAVMGVLEPGDLQLNNGGTTKTTRLIVTSTTDVDYTAGNEPPLVIGDPAGQHMRLDGNELVAMSDPSTRGFLLLNGSHSFRAWGWAQVTVTPDSAGNATVSHGLGVVPAVVLVQSNTEGIGVVSRNYTATGFGVGANRMSDGGSVVNPFTMTFFAIV